VRKARDRLDGLTLSVEVWKGDHTSPFSGGFCLEARILTDSGLIPLCFLAALIDGFEGERPGRRCEKKVLSHCRVAIYDDVVRRICRFTTSLSMVYVIEFDDMIR
jgi:hypothetical protein